MENEIIPRIRPNENETHYRKNSEGQFVEIPSREAVPDAGQQSAHPDIPATPGVPEEPPETEQEREARERREFIEITDDEEIVDGGNSTTAYRRAIAVFDEKDDRLQLAEHYYYRCADYERYGRF